MNGLHEDVGDEPSFEEKARGVYGMDEEFYEIYGILEEFWGEAEEIPDEELGAGDA